MVGISKAMWENYSTGPDACRLVAVGIDGYDNVMAARSMGYYLASSSEWGFARDAFFEKKSEKYPAKTAAMIELGFLTGFPEQTGSFLSFSTGKLYPPDTNKLLNKRGFDGNVALIDLPEIEIRNEGTKAEPIFRRIMTGGKRTRITDVTDKLPKDSRGNYLTAGFIHEYEWDTGLWKSVGDYAHKDCDGGSFELNPHGTVMILRGFQWFRPDYAFDREGKKKNPWMKVLKLGTGDPYSPFDFSMYQGKSARFSIDATHNPASNGPVMAMRFSKKRDNFVNLDLD